MTKFSRGAVGGLLLVIGCGAPPPLEISGPAEPLEGFESGSVAFRREVRTSPSAPKDRTGAETRALFEEPEFVTTDSGLKYAVLEPGEGDPPTPADRVAVHYTGVLENGALFDTSAGRRDPVTFGLGGVIDGWTEGLQQIGEGGRILLICPPDLAYGEEGSPPSIPPEATLYFDVELLGVIRARAE